uniref:Transposase n=1 Tax=Heterorhabditis bacteriophora TaxID=37862 RepID=A0A1I7X1I4_HETBA
MTEDSLYYYLYRGSSSHNKDLIEAIIEETKNYVFEDRGLLLSAQGKIYSSCFNSNIYGLYFLQGIVEFRVWFWRYPPCNKSRNKDQQAS